MSAKIIPIRAALAPPRPLFPEHQTARAVYDDAVWALNAMAQYKTTPPEWSLVLRTAADTLRQRADIICGVARDGLHYTAHANLGDYLDSVQIEAEQQMEESNGQ